MDKTRDRDPELFKVAEQLSPFATYKREFQISTYVFDGKWVAQSKSESGRYSRAAATEVKACNRLASEAGFPAFEKWLYMRRMSSNG
jgi:hypothetical protein